METSKNEQSYKTILNNSLGIETSGTETKDPGVSLLSQRLCNARPACLAGGS